MKNCTIRDVAQLAGVSISSVSRYLKDPNSINPIAALAVGDAIKKLDYTPNPFAQNLKRESSNVIAVLLPDISHSFFARACRALEMLFYQNNYLVMICDTDEDAEKERFYVEAMLKQRVAGMMIVSSGENSEYLKKVIEENSHIMLFDRLVDGVKANCVYENNEEAGMQLTQHMISKGYRDFAVITGDRRSKNTQLRLKGILEACTQAGISLNEKYIYQDVVDFSALDKIEAIISQLIQDPEAPRCVIACNPKLTDNMVIAAYKQHLAVPQQLALCGFSIDNPKNLYSIPVCTMRQDPYHVGMKSGEMMLKMIRNKSKTKTPKKVYLSMELCD